MVEENKVKDIVQAVEGVVKAVPIYQDGLQPAVKQLGASLETVARSVNVALAPLRGLVWGFEQFESWLQTSVAAKLRHVPPDRIVTPDLTVAGPTADALRFAGHSEELRELYATLLARSMDRETASSAHPAFVEIIKQLTPDEARILRHLAHLAQKDVPLIAALDIQIEVPPKKLPSPVQFVTAGSNISMLTQDAGCARPQQGPVYLDNLCRLGILDVNPFHRAADYDKYERIKKSPDVLADVERLKQIGKIMWNEKAYHLTPLGHSFLQACVMETTESQPITEHVEPIPTCP